MTERFLLISISRSIWSGYFLWLTCFLQQGSSFLQKSNPNKKKTTIKITNKTKNPMRQKKNGGHGGHGGYGGHSVGGGVGVIGGNSPGHITTDTWLILAGFPESTSGETKSVSPRTLGSYWYRLNAFPPLTITA